MGGGGGSTAGAEAGEAGESVAPAFDAGTTTEIEAEATQAAKIGTEVATKQTPQAVTTAESNSGAGVEAGTVETTRSAAPVTDTPSENISAAPTSPLIAPSDVAGKTPAEIDALARERGLIPKGPDPMGGDGIVR